MHFLSCYLFLAISLISLLYYISAFYFLLLFFSLPFKCIFLPARYFLAELGIILKKKIRIPFIDVRIYVTVCLGSSR